MNKGLYDSSFEHDNCGIGAVVNIKGVKTHMTVSNALKIVEQLEHRAGKDAKGETGDGVGILTQIPYTFFKKSVKDFQLPKEGHYGVGQFFFPMNELERHQAMTMFEKIITKEGMTFLGWRKVREFDSCLQFFTNQIAQNVDYINAFEFFYCQICENKCTNMG